MIKFEVNQKSGQKISKSLWQLWFKKINKILKLKQDIEISVAVVGDKRILYSDIEQNFLQLKAQGDKVDENTKCKITL